MNVWNEAVEGPVYEKAQVARPYVTQTGPAPRNACRFALKVAAALCLWLTSLHAAADGKPPSDINYRLGEGLRVADTGFSLGGYATATYEKLHGTSPRASLDDLSLFVWWQGEGRWKFFAELDYENALTSRSINIEEEKRYLALERIYFDYAVTDTINIRAGKFLTPIGRWNLIHATPLVWTTSRPLVTQGSFPTNATGLMVNGTLPGLSSGVEYSIYASRGGEVRPNPAQDPFSEAVGAHVTLPLPGDGQLGLSYAAFEQEKVRDEKKQLLGADFVWSRNRHEISGEAIYRFSDNGRSLDEKGAFVQLVLPVSDKLFAVGRYEIIHKALEHGSTQLWVTGLNYRVTPAIVLKAELIGGKHNRIDAREGFMSSISLLF